MHEAAVVRRLRVGVVPGSVLEQLSVGYEQLSQQLLDGMHGLRLGRQPTALFVRGEWGSGKSHCLTFARLLARQRGVAASMVSLNARSSPLNYPQRFYPVLAANLEDGSAERGLRPLLTSWLLDPSKRARLLAFSRDSAAGELRWALYTLASRHDFDEIAAPQAEWTWNTLLGSDLSWGDYPYKRAKALDRVQALSSMLRQVGLPGLVLTLDEAETIDQLWNVRSRLVAYEVLGRLTTMPGVWCVIGVTERFARTVEGDLARGLLDATDSPQPARQFLRAWQDKAFDVIELPAIDRAMASTLARKVADLYHAAYPVSAVDRELVAHCVRLWSQNPSRNPRRLIRLMVHHLDLGRMLGHGSTSTDG